MSSHPSSQWFSASEAERVRGLFIPLSGYAILLRIRDPSHREKFLDGVVSINQAGHSQAEIISYYDNLPRDRIPGYDSEGPQQSRNSRQAGPARENHAN